MGFQYTRWVSLVGLLLIAVTSAAATAPVYTRSNNNYDNSSFDTETSNLPTPKLGGYAPAPGQVQWQPDLPANAANTDQVTLVNKVAELEQTVRELRGQLEVQQHDLQQLQQGQQQLYTDLDRRINQLGAGNTPIPVTLPAAASKNVKQPPQQQVAGDNAMPISNSEAEQALQQQRDYEQAYQLLRSKQFSQATAHMQQYVQRYPNGQYASNAHYWLGELALLAGNPPQAKQEFGIIIKNYPNSSKVPDAMLKLAVLEAESGNSQQANRQLQQIQDKYPNTTAAQLAEQQMKQLNMQGR